ncbi:aminoglycoside phosphotransferase family protein [Kitasatospora sp. GAS204B]|uniref:aminoglycoside phosphotransferase family protein n=1 Tax=unclassified Kitasatospora TaxID=2633591 RepID=UPI00247633E8|nr:aminoglycoside phosphotransferase family protein [Kitasatospora sp. GAS204B]MDH6122881.1 streptomycin 6-kinase [Kitasatospora sp. GAS204B]
MTAELFPSTLPVVTTLGGTESGRAWLARLPAIVADLRSRWSLRLEAPFHGGSCSWVAPAHLPDGTPVVLKVSWPHREAAGEAEALRLWDGNGAVYILRDDREHQALLLERCDPGHPLGTAHDLAAQRRLLLGTEILRELWQTPVPAQTCLEQLGDVTAEWADLAQERMDRLRPGFDPSLVAHGIRLLRELPATATREVVVHGDFNSGNVVAASRRPWLAIDAKPMIGDPGYDPWPLLEEIDDPFAHADPHRVLADRFALVADATGEDAGRLQAWGIARRVETALSVLAEGDMPGAAGVIREARVLADLLGA